MTRRRAGALVLTAKIVALGAAAGILVIAPGGAAGGGAPRLVDEAATAGLATRYDGNADYATGGGVAAFDCDDDRKPELLLAGGANPSTLDRNESPIGGALRFAPVPAATLGDLAETLEAGVLGAYPLDVDGDGLTDLAVLRGDGLRLFRGSGGCRFVSADRGWSFDGGSGWTTAFSATWEAPAALPTLAIGRYLRAVDGAQTTGCDVNALVRPVEGEPRYAAPLSLEPGFCTLSMLFSDWDDSGRRDLRVTNDRQYYVDGGEQLWRVEPGAPPRPYSTADGWRPVEIWGMGIATRDITGDGFPEVYLTSQGDNKLQSLAAGADRPDYRDIAAERGVSATRPFTGGDILPSTAWHPAFEDVNDDGLVDLFVSKGNVNAMADYAARDPSNLLLGRPDGTFREAADAAGIVSFARGRGAAVVDLNLDGLLDVVQVNYGGPASIWRNVGGGDAAAPRALGSWLQIRLTDPARGNRDAIGAWLEVRVGDAVQRRELTIGGGHLGGQLGWVHVGLGAAERAEIRVRWPDGELSPWLAAAADQFVDIERGDAAVRPWSPAAP